ncbi:MAG: chorismate lyase [Pseudomonadota bacterium]
MTASSTSDDAHWQTLNHHHRQLPLKIQQWLFDQGSLTAKLLARSKGRLAVEVLQQRIERARLSEYRCLGMSHRRWAVVREVVLYGDNVPWVYARTIIPLSTLKGRLRRLHYLGNRPLGSQLFADPTLQRQVIEFAKLHKEQLPQNIRSLKPGWGRRSVFVLQHKPLLVCEVFLDSLLESQ